MKPLREREREYYTFYPMAVLETKHSGAGGLLSLTGSHILKTWNIVAGRPTVEVLVQYTKLTAMTSTLAKLHACKYKFGC